ncbi:MAG: hypothetical protein E6J87_18485 [Deltaproteobacteria bacterium]|nr:MAG: hypothetical protein E6J87_18485 [Deltaproteobacteria bacterium]
MDGLPVTIRLLDLPLHEFLPTADSEVQEVAAALGASAAEVRAKIDALREFNPMLGHRGCRLGITFPEIYRMQAQAIAGAAREVAEAGGRIRPEIMIPLVSHAAELERLRALVLEEVSACFAGARVRVPFQIGTMIEVPRAALTADRIAQSADFFSFGTNDLTQMTYALSRDDAARFLPKYLTFPEIYRMQARAIAGAAREVAESGGSIRPEIMIPLVSHAAELERLRAVVLEEVRDCFAGARVRVPIARLAAAQAALA